MRVRTGYSFRRAAGHLKDVMVQLKHNGAQCAPISDTMSTFGFKRWTELCKKNGLEPKYGVELAVVRAMGEKRPALDYWTFFAKHSLKDLHSLISKATLNPGREPSLSYHQAMEAEGLIKMVGERANMDAIVPHPDLYVALSPSLPKLQFEAAKARGLKFAATSDNVYSAEGDRELYRVMLGRRAYTQTYPQHILSLAEWLEACEYIADGATLAAAVENTRTALQSCSATLKMARMLVPEKEKTLEQMCKDGAATLGIDLNDPVYAARIERELVLIKEKGFEDYFYIIADLVQWARQRMIVGPARGSSCGSLVCYLIGITTVDPIPFGLIFERFIDINRDDIPDIDIDFSDQRRHLVFEYAEQKYGRDHVARLGTVGMFQPRSALKQAGVALRVPQWKVNKVLDSVIARSSGDSRASQQLEDTLKDTHAGQEVLAEFPEILIAGRMEGHPNNASQHAAGIIITEDPVTEFVAVDERTRSIMCDKKDAEALNLLKIDALGLTQLSIFERTLELIGEATVSGWLEKLPLDDQAAFDVLNKSNWSGIFQFNGNSLQSLTKQIKVDNIEDIISITALARPGPMATGGAHAWVKRRAGTEEVTYPHPVFEPWLKDTMGVVIFQEQVMTIGKEIGDLSWADVSNLRKAMSKSLGKEYFDQFGDRWKAAAVKKGVPAEVLDSIWDDLCAYGSWAFNRSHAVAYGLVSYWCCWFKAHHPLEFAAATLDALSDPDKQIAMLRELEAEGIDYVAMDPALSDDKWRAAKRDNRSYLIGPLTNVKGIGPASVHEIMTARKNGEELKPGLKKRLDAAITDIDSLYPVQDAIERLHPDLTQRKIMTEPKKVVDVQCGLQGEVVIIAKITKIAPKDENEQVNVARRGGRKLTGPTAALNMFFSDDTDEIFCKINRYKFEQLGRAIVDRGRAGKALYAIKGTVPKDFRMISVNNIRYMGEVDQEEWTDEQTQTVHK